jgi:hypothetical protein
MQAINGSFTAVLASEFSTTPTPANCAEIVPWLARVAAAAAPEALDTSPAPRLTA